MYNTLTQQISGYKLSYTGSNMSFHSRQAAQYSYFFHVSKPFPRNKRKIARKGEENTGVSKEMQHSCLKMRLVGSGIRTRERLDRSRSIGFIISSYNRKINLKNLLEEIEIWIEKAREKERQNIWLGWEEVNAKLICAERRWRRRRVSVSKAQDFVRFELLRIVWINYIN